MRFVKLYIVFLSLVFGLTAKAASKDFAKRFFYESQLATTNKILNSKLEQKEKLTQKLNELRSNLGLIESFKDHASQQKLKKNYAYHLNLLNETDQHIQDLQKNLEEIKKQVLIRK